MPLPAGATLGRYVIESLVGRGGFGEVYRAHDPQLRRPVAIKVLHGDLRPDRLRRFEVEARAAATINHPNVVSVLDVGTHETGPFVVTEFLEGESLRSRLRRDPLSTADAVRIAAEVADGLSAAHARRLVHRDLKPDNVFLVAGGRAKILDFGLAKPMADEAAGAAVSTETALTEAGAILGTPAYMAPEQIRAAPVDHRADIFALGVMLFEMLAGRTPFVSHPPALALSSILRDDPAPLPASSTRPAALDQVVSRCLEKEPAARFQSASDLAFALRSAGAPRRGRSAALATVALILLVAGALWTMGVFNPQVFRRAEPAQTEPDVSAELEAASLAALEASLQDYRFATEFPSTAPPDAPKPFSGSGNSKARISLSVTSAKIDAVLYAIARAAKWPVVIDDSVTGSVSLDLKDVPWDLAVRSIVEFKGADLALTRYGDVWHVCSRRRLDEIRSNQLYLWVSRSQAIGAEALARLFEPARTDRALLLVNRRLNAVIVIDTLAALPGYARAHAAVDNRPIEEYNFSEMSAFTGNPVTLDLFRTSAEGAINALTVGIGINVVLQAAPDVANRTVTVATASTRWDNVLDVVIRSMGLRYTVTGKLLHLIPRSLETADLTVATLTLTNESPSFFKPLERYLSKRGALSVEESRRVLVIRDTPEKVEMLRRFVNQVDRAEP